MLKIYLYPLLSCLPSQIASTFINLLADMHFTVNEGMYENSCRRILVRLEENSFEACIHTYLDRLLSIDQHIRER